MKTDDYRKSLDQIKCSDEFRRKMEELLSQPAENFSGYETKFTVEKAPKISVSRYVAIAAALVFIVGAGSVALNSMRMGRNLDNAATESSVYENNAENVINRHNCIYNQRNGDKTEYGFAAHAHIF